MQSARQQLRDSGLFKERTPQQNGTVSFAVKWAVRGATVYVDRNDVACRIRINSLDTNLFPNKERLYAFVRAHAHRKVREGEEAYEIASEYLRGVIRIIGAGLYRGPTRL